MQAVVTPPPAVKEARFLPEIPGDRMVEEMHAELDQVANLNASHVEVVLVVCPAGFRTGR